MKYLTPEKKNYYQKELQKCVVCKDEEWNLDKGLLPILTNINRNPNIQTTLSKRPENIIYGNNRSATSELHIAFKENMKHKLQIFKFRLVKKFKAECVFFDGPLKMDNSEALNDKNLCNLECITEVEKYTDITVFYIHYFAKTMKEHKDFWKFLEDNLSHI